MFKPLKLPVLIATMLIISTTMVGCSTSPTGKKQLSLVSDQQMSAMGVSTFTEMKKQTPASRDRRKVAYVQCIGNAITGQLDSSQQWEVTLFADDQVNAFALPGGKIGVYEGLLEVAETPDQLAAVMGHEVAHVLADHGKARLSANLASQAGLAIGSIALGTQLEGNGRLALAALGVGMQVGVLMPYGRGQESEADVLGLDLSARAGFDPRASTQLWLNMEKANGASAPELLSTHPAPTSRIRALQAQMPKALSTYQAARSAGRSPRCRL